MTFDELTLELEAYCRDQGLPYESADELVFRPELNPEQRRWVSDFICRWDAAADAEQT